MNNALAITASTIPPGLAYQIHHVVSRLKTIMLSQEYQKNEMPALPFFSICINSCKPSNGVNAIKRSGANPPAGQPAHNKMEVRRLNEARFKKFIGLQK